MFGWQIKLRDALVTHGAYLSALEIKILYIFIFIRHNGSKKT